MEINLTKKPMNPLIIHGFPGFGLVGSISTEFLINHLNMEDIGNIWIDDLPAMVAIHNEEVVQPIGVFYDKNHNIIILHVVTAAKDIEWKLAEALAQMADMLKAREILCIEGVNSNRETENLSIFCYANKKTKKTELTKKGIKPLKEGIIVGVTSALLLKIKQSHDISCLFAETHSNFPDSKAAAKVIEAIDKYIGLSVDYKPLLETAKVMEDKLKNILTQSAEVAKEKERKNLSYVG